MTVNIESIGYMVTEVVKDATERMFDFDKGNFAPDIAVYSFPQTWGSTALGFGGVGGQAFTDAQTVVVVYRAYENPIQAVVYFAGRFAYKVENPNNEFWNDLRSMDMKEVMKSGKYRKGA